MLRECNVEQLNYDLKIIDFMRWDLVALTISGLILCTCFFIMILKGFNLGLDFTGGTVIELTSKQAPDLNIVRDAVKKAGYPNPVIQKLGNNHDLIIRIGPIQELSNKIVNVVKGAIKGDVVIKSIESIGPSVDTEMAPTSILALLVALICILFYLGLRFEWRLALGTIIALVHDVIITLGLLSLLSIEIDLNILASLMSVIGYSLNDSVVISDRIRENFRNINHGTPYEIINVSITQTLKRTIVTSATAIAAVLILYIFGGTMLKNFSLTMLIGISVGTISSIYVASVIALKLGINSEHIVLPKIKQEEN
ncbi:protein translocase subunit SecF [Candidatus Profftia tarda]|uniref:protein translocase subunit SecF n=1 Tax=Candidatus Profftia tarda TaxID=1177216 RepID=UPI001C1FD683|nr:protein translocase subunit SecF [Candidatus Profftia tarda]